MQIIQWPNLLTSFNLALHEVLRSFFKTGGVHNFYGIATNVHRCSLHYNRDTILDPGDRPRIAFLGDRPASPSPALSPGKCQSGGSRVKVMRTPVERITHVIIPRGEVYQVPPYTGQSRPADKQMLDEVWQNLLIVIHGVRDEFRARGIIDIKLDHFPQEKSDDQYLVNTGRLVATVEYEMQTGFSPDNLPVV